MKRRWLWALLLTLGPGLAIGLAVIGYGLFLEPPRYLIAEWRGEWSEPRTRAPGIFQSFRKADRDGESIVIAETEPWPHKHPRANSYLLSDGVYTGDVEVSMRAQFLRGRYLGCYLCYDVAKGDGYWLATGHAVGDEPNHAYIKIVREGKWEVMARAPLEILPQREYQLAFGRTGEQIWVRVDGKKVVQWEDSEFHSGQVQLRLHNTKVAIGNLTVRGTSVENAVSSGAMGQSTGP